MTNPDAQGRLNCKNICLNTKHKVYWAQEDMC